MENIMVMGIAGGSGSGKTTLVKNLVEKFGDVITVISHDNYYKRRDELTYENKGTDLDAWCLLYCVRILIPSAGS